MHSWNKRLKEKWFSHLWDNVRKAINLEFNLIFNILAQPAGISYPHPWVRLGKYSATIPIPKSTSISPRENNLGNRHNHRDATPTIPICSSEQNYCLWCGFCAPNCTNCVIFHLMHSTDLEQVQYKPFIFYAYERQSRKHQKGSKPKHLKG